MVCLNIPGFGAINGIVKKPPGAVHLRKTNLSVGTNTDVRLFYLDWRREFEFIFDLPKLLTTGVATKERF